MASKDFNYQVALKEGLKSLEQGRLRQAEQSFKYLVDKFPGAEGGYRGLAKVHFEQDDRTAALRVLRDGAAALTKSGERSGAIGLLRQAVTLDPRDLATHRRLAAGLALAGDPDAAVEEYARFIRDLRDNGDGEKAKNEAAYAKGQLRGVKGVSALDAILNGAPTVRELPIKREERLGETAASSDGETSNAVESPTPPARSVTAPPDDPWAAPPPVTPSRPTRSEQRVRDVTLENDPWATIPTPPLRSWTSDQQMGDEGEPAATAPAPASAESPVAEREVQESGVEEVVTSEDEPAGNSFMAPSEDGQPTIGDDPAAVEAAAARYLGTRDSRAAGLALEAARHYVKEGYLDAASDLLLQMIAAGVANHDAQRLLVEVVRTLGKREVADMKVQLLAHALRLDGREDLAAEVEALAIAD